MKSFFYLFIFLFFICLDFAGYSDVLLVTNNNSSDSLAIGSYFVQLRNITHWVNVTLPNNSEVLSFAQMNTSVIQPIRAYLNSSNGTGINYIVLTKGVPTYMRWNGIPDWAVDDDAASVDSEIALINTAYESSIGQNGSVANPYYGSNAKFTRALFGIYLVSRLDGYNVSSAESLVDRAGGFIVSSRNSGNALLTNPACFMTSQIASANLTLAGMGLNVIVNNTCVTGGIGSTLPNVPYSNVSFALFYQYGSFIPSGFPNISWKQGGLAVPIYSYSARSTLATGSDETMASDLVGQGATAVYGSSKEPYTSGSIQPDVVSTNFAANMPYIDAIWSAVPKLSWGAVAFGDPRSGPPSISVSISPFPAFTNSNLTCGVYVSAVNSSVNITYEWYKNGVNQTSLGGAVFNVPTEANANISNLSSGNLSLGDTWLCKASAYSDGSLLSSANQSARIGVGCQVISVPNSAYNLTSDAVSFGTTCFNVSAQNVTLDCNGYGIIGNNTSSTYGIYSNQFNTTVKNCNISGFQYGIHFNNATNGSIQHTNASTTQPTGIAVYFVSSHNNSLSSIIANSSSDSVVSLDSCLDNVFSNVTVASSSGTGIYLLSCLNNTFSNITATTDSGTSIDLLGSSGNVFSIVTSTSTGDVISIYNSANNVFSDLTANSVSGKGINLDTNFGGSFGADRNNFSNVIVTSTSGIGVYLDDASNNRFSNVTATSGTGSGIHLRGSSNNVFSTVMATSNSSYGMTTSSFFFVINHYSTNNNFSNCTISSISSSGIYLPSGSDNVFSNVTATSDSSYGIYTLASDNLFSNVTATSNSSYGMALAPGSINTIANSSLQGAGDLLFTPSSVSECANAIINNTGIGGLSIIYYSHTATISNAASAAIILCNASDSSIASSNASTGGIRLYYTDRTSIANSTAASALDSGIYLNSSSSNNITNNTISGAIGCAFASSTSNIFLDNRLTAPIWISQSGGIGSTCVQETATQSTACGGLGNGSYALEGTWILDSGASTYDADYDSGSYANDGSEAYLYSNYTIPPDASGFSWVAKSEEGIVTMGSTEFSSGCLGHDILGLRVKSTSVHGTYVSYSCFDHDMNDFVEITRTSGLLISPIIYEERIEWQLSVAATNFFNSSASGNTYYFDNGSGAWTAFDIKDLDGDGWAEHGTARPFNSTNVGGNWSGLGEDWYPGIPIIPPQPQPTPQPASSSSSNGGGEVYIPLVQMPAENDTQPEQSTTFPPAIEPQVENTTAAPIQPPLKQEEKPMPQAVKPIVISPPPSPSQVIPLATISMIGGAVILVGTGIYAYLQWGRKN